MVTSTPKRALTTLFSEYELNNMTFRHCVSSIDSIQGLSLCPSLVPFPYISSTCCTICWEKKQKTCRTPEEFLIKTTLNKVLIKQSDFKNAITENVSEGFCYFSKVLTASHLHLNWVFGKQFCQSPKLHAEERLCCSSNLSGHTLDPVLTAKKKELSGRRCEGMNTGLGLQLATVCIDMLFLS